MSTSNRHPGLTGLLLLLLLTALPLAEAGEQADRALQQVRAMIASGESAADTVLKLVVKQGNIANFLGQDYELKNQWEQATGILIDAAVMPQKPSLAFIREAQNVDITIARNRELPDLYHQGLITDLTPILSQFGFTLDDNPINGYFLPELQSRFGDRVVAIPADGDMAVLYLRKDLLENRDKQAKYNQQFGVALKVPQTWQEYQRQVAFFHDPDNGFYGSLEQRDQASGWMFWIPRYTAQSHPNQYFFDEQMNPLIDSPAGIKATESYLATLAFSPAKILDPQSNYTYTLPLFVNGNGYSTIITLAGAKVSNLSSSKVKDRFLATPMPGVDIDGQIHRRTTLIYGNNIVIPSNSPNPKLAVLFALWLTDPDVSVRSITVKAGFSDPYRYHHFSNPQVATTYSPEVLNTVKQTLNSVIPAGTGLAGDTEYIDALNLNLYRAAAGLQTAAQAMSNTAAQWQRITDHYGREQQVQQWRKVRSHYPQARAQGTGTDAPESQ